MQPIIEIRHLSKTFGSGENQVAALQDVSLEVNPGEIFGIIGLNKAKKFTEECGQLFGKAKVGKYLSLGGLIAGSCVTAYVVFYIFIAVIAAIAEYS